MQLMMNNPEIAQLLQQPGMLEKMQQMQSNPMEAMNDPDMMRLMTALQSSGAMNDIMGAMQSGGINPSSFGGGGGASPFGGMGGATGSSGSNTNTGTVHEITSPGQLRNWIREGTEKYIPVIIDFTAVWCGPCKVLAPKFQQLAQSYGNRAIFIKIDGDRNRDLVEQYNVSAFPTIITIVQGDITDTIRGADMNAIERAISVGLSKCEELREALNTNRFKHFPIRENECVFYRPIAWDKVKQKFTTTLVDNCDAEFYHEYTSPSALLTDIMSLCTFLENYKTHSMTSLSAQQIKALDSILSWPEQHYATPLHILRIALFHADTAKQFATGGLCKGDQDNVLIRVMHHIQHTDNNMIAILTLRTLCSAFEKRSIARTALQSCEHMLELITVLMLTFGDDQHVVTSSMSLLLNLSFMIFDMANVMDVSNAVKSILPCLLETLPLANPDEQTLYKMLVCLGTILLSKTSQQFKPLLEQAGAKDTLTEWKQTYTSNTNLQEIIQEIISIL